MTTKERKPEFKSLIQDPANQLHLAIANYPKISKASVGGKETWKKVKTWIEEYTESTNEKFKDVSWEGVQGLGEAVGRNIGNFLEMYKGLSEEESPNPKIVLKALTELENGSHSSLFGELRIKDQKMWDTGFVYIIDALNTLTTQPSLIYRLFERKKIKKDGIYPIWVNINGKWQNLIVDELMPIIETDQGVKIPLFIKSSLETKVDLWAPLLFKALVKSVSPSYKQSKNGFEPYAMNSFTGAPYSIYDVVHINSRGELTPRDQEQMGLIWKKFQTRLKKGYMISVAARLADQRETLRIGDAINKLGIWAAQQKLSQEDFFSFPDVTDNFNFDGIEGLEEIITIFDNLGLRLFERVEIEGEKKVIIKPGFGQKIKQNLAGYVNFGIWSNHNYAMVTVKEVQSEGGQVHRMVKLRNAWQGEEYTGLWSKSYPNLTVKMKQQLKVNDNDSSEFWMDLIEFMQIFETTNVYKTSPTFIHESIPIQFPVKPFLRAVVKITIQFKGKYTFSIDQKDLHMYKEFHSEKYRHNPIKLTLGMLEQGKFQVFSHTSSTKLRNTYIRKLINPGDYYLLLEQDTRNQMPKNRNPAIVLSTYGPKSSNPKLLEYSVEANDIQSFKQFQLPEILTKNIQDKSLVPVSPPSDPLAENMPLANQSGSSDVLYDYLLYQSWKEYSQKRPGILIQENNINFYGGSWQKVNLYLLNVPDMVIYAFQNPNKEFGVELKAKIHGTKGVEAIGPGSEQISENDLLNNQTFGSSINGCHLFDLSSEDGTDIFMLRDLEETASDPSENKASNFKIESVVGVQYKGVKDRTLKSQEVYNWLQDKTKPSIWKFAEIEKDDRALETFGVFDPITGDKMSMKTLDVIETKTKRVMSRIGREELEDKLEIVNDKEGLGEKLKHVADGSRRSGSVLNERSRHRSMSAVRTPVTETVDEESIEFVEDSNVLQVGDPSKNQARRLIRQANDDKRSSKSAVVKKRSKSILKNQNANFDQEDENVHSNDHLKTARFNEAESRREVLKSSAEKKKPKEQENSDEKGSKYETIQPVGDYVLQELLKLTKEELFDLDCKSMQQMIKTLGYKTFLEYYNLNKFDVCALDKICDHYIAFLEARQLLKQKKELEIEVEEGQEHEFEDEKVEETKPNLSQVMDLNELLKEIQVGTYEEPILEEREPDVLHKLIDQNGDKLDVLWNQFGEIMIFNKLGEQVFIESEIPPQFIPPMPEELKEYLEQEKLELQNQLAAQIYQSIKPVLVVEQADLSVTISNKPQSHSIDQPEDSVNKSSAVSSEDFNSEDDEDVILAKEMERIKFEQERKKLELEQKRKELERKQRELEEEQLRIQKEFEADSQTELEKLREKAMLRIKNKKERFSRALETKQTTGEIYKDGPMPVIVDSILFEDVTPKQDDKTTKFFGDSNPKKLTGSIKDKYKSKLTKKKSIELPGQSIKAYQSPKLVTEIKAITSARENTRDLKIQMDRRNRQIKEISHPHLPTAQKPDIVSPLVHARQLLKDLKRIGSPKSSKIKYLTFPAQAIEPSQDFIPSAKQSPQTNKEAELLTDKNNSAKSFKDLLEQKKQFLRSKREKMSPLSNVIPKKQQTNQFGSASKVNTANLTNRLENIKSLQGKVNKYFKETSLGDISNITPIGEDLDLQITPRNLITPNNKQINEVQNGSNTINLYNKNPNKSYGAINTLDLSVEEFADNSHMLRQQQIASASSNQRHFLSDRQMDKVEVSYEHATPEHFNSTQKAVNPFANNQNMGGNLDSSQTHNKADLYASYQGKFGQKNTVYAVDPEELREIKGPEFNSPKMKGNVLNKTGGFNFYDTSPSPLLERFNNFGSPSFKTGLPMNDVNRGSLNYKAFTQEKPSGLQAYSRFGGQGSPMSNTRLNMNLFQNEPSFLSANQAPQHTDTRNYQSLTPAFGRPDIAPVSNHAQNPFNTYQQNNIQIQQSYNTDEGFNSRSKGNILQTRINQQPFTDKKPRGSDVQFSSKFTSNLKNPSHFQNKGDFGAEEPGFQSMQNNNNMPSFKSVRPLNTTYNSNQNNGTSSLLMAQKAQPRPNKPGLHPQQQGFTLSSKQNIERRTGNDVTPTNRNNGVRNEPERQSNVSANRLGRQLAYGNAGFNQSVGGGYEKKTRGSFMNLFGQQSKNVIRC